MSLSTSPGPDRSRKAFIVKKAFTKSVTEANCFPTQLYYQLSYLGKEIHGILYSYSRADLTYLAEYTVLKV